METWNLLNSSRLHLPRPSAVALEVQRLNALDLERKIGKSILGKVRRIPVPEPTQGSLRSSTNCFLQAGWAALGHGFGLLGSQTNTAVSVAGPSGHGTIPRGWAIL